MRLLLRRIACSVDALLGFPPRQPPLAPALAMVTQPSASASLSTIDIREIVNQMSILWGVPKYRTSKPKKWTRKFSYTRLFVPKTNIVTCSTCGTLHESETICGKCYEKVRLLTNEIKEKMMQYNPYKGERQDKEVEVRFNDDSSEEGVWSGKRVVELEKPRPSWFKRIK